MILVHVQYICMDVLMVQNSVAPLRRKRKRRSAAGTSILGTVLETSLASVFSPSMYVLCVFVTPGITFTFTSSSLWGWEHLIYGEGWGASGWTTAAAAAKVWSSILHFRWTATNWEELCIHPDHYSKGWCILCLLIMYICTQKLLLKNHPIKNAMKDYLVFINTIHFYNSMRVLVSKKYSSLGKVI